MSLYQANQITNQITEIMSNISTTLTFMGSVEKEDDLPLYPNVGDTYLVREDNGLYCCLRNYSGPKKWELLECIDIDTNYTPEPKEECSGELTDCKCENCGAPLRMVSKFKYHCEYCGSEFQSLNYNASHF